MESILLTCTLSFYALLNNPTSLSTGINLLACTDSSNYVHPQRHLLSNCFRLFQNQCNNDSLLIDEFILPLSRIIVNTIFKFFPSFSFFFWWLTLFSHCFVVIIFIAYTIQTITRAVVSILFSRQQLLSILLGYRLSREFDSCIKKKSLQAA